MNAKLSPALKGSQYYFVTPENKVFHLVSDPKAQCAGVYRV